MGIPIQPLPTIGQPNSTEDAKVRSALSEAQTILTGNVDSSNLAPNAVTLAKIADNSVTDAKLSNPNNAVWRPVFFATSVYSMAAMALNTFYYADLGAPGNPVASGANGTAPVLWAPQGTADEAVPGKTTQIRLRTTVTVNGINLGTALTMGLYSVSSVTGGSANLIPTLGAAAATTSQNVAAGGTAAAASAPVSLASLSGVYAFAGSIAANGTSGSRCVVNFILEMSHV